MLVKYITISLKDGEVNADDESRRSYVAMKEVNTDDEEKDMRKL